MMLLAADQSKRRGRPKGTPNKTPHLLGRSLSANARRMLALRRQHNMTQREMADVLKVQTDTVSRWERGTINCPDRMVLMAETLLEGQKKKR